MLYVPALARNARILLLPCVVALGLAACGLSDDLAERPEPIGDFRLGFPIVVAANMEQGPFSRDASAEEVEEALRGAMQARLGRYEGDRYYHVAVSVAAYVLAQPGIPLVASPRSIFILNVDVWDDERQEKLTARPALLTVIDDSARGFMASGLTQTREEQLVSLSAAAAREIEAWLRENGSLVGGEDQPRVGSESGA
ncbi:MAG: hypothetical protein JJU40_08070 [Rhodobacteraceae bacterium]|nr:hypothetical protein [Paracoccaceae bacterium]